MNIRSLFIFIGIINCLIGQFAVAEVRSLDLYNVHTRERKLVVFKRNGVYDSRGLATMNWLLRDWRKNKTTTMDPRLFDTMWRIYVATGSSSPIYIISGYRTPATNKMLRSRTSGVSKYSNHMLGRAIDFYIPGVPLEKLRLLSIKQERGGVGVYYDSNFIHIDLGAVRTWPTRLSRKQLLALFPDGKTLHIPSDGPPLPGYKSALAKASLSKVEAITGRTRADYKSNRGAPLKDRAKSNSSKSAPLKIKKATSNSGQDTSLKVGQPLTAGKVLH